MADFTPTQGRYLAFIHAYTRLYGFPPAESEISTALGVSPPSVNQMVKVLEKKGFLLRVPGKARSLRVLIPEEEIPAWASRKSIKSTAKVWMRVPERPSRATKNSAAPPANLYVLTTFLQGGPVDEKFANKEISRVIEIRGDQTLEDLHLAIFKAHDRWDEHLYEFQLGKRPFDPAGPKYGIAGPEFGQEGVRDASTTTLDSLGLKPERTFGYWFDFGDDWYHQIQVERIDQAIPTVTYPRVIKRVGKSPPQYPDNPDE